MLDPSALAALGDRVELGEERIDEATGRRFGVVRRTDRRRSRRPPVEEPPALPESIVRQWLLPAVYERMRTGRGEFLAELRAAYPLFLRFGGIDYDDDDEADAKLDAFVSKAQEILDGYGGNVLQLTLGDKGAYLYGVFGSPLAHEDDAARAAAAALELRDLETTTAATGIQIGITHGRLRSGTYGHPMRRTFVCLGDAVNLSARLMSAAPAGGIYVSRTVRDDAGDAFAWDALEPLRVKGKAEPVEVFALTGSLARMSRRQVRYELPLVGRRAELRGAGSPAGRGAAGSRPGRRHRRRGRAWASRDSWPNSSAPPGGPVCTWPSGSARPSGPPPRTCHGTRCGEACSGSSTPDGVGAVEGEDDPERQRADRGTGAPTHRPRPGRPGAAPRSRHRRAHPGQRADLGVRSRSCARLRWRICWPDASAPGPGSRSSSSSRTATGSTSSRRACWRRWSGRPRRCPCCSWSPTGPATSVGGDLGLERLPQFHELPLSRLDADETAALIRSKLGQLTGADAEAPDALVSLIAGRAEGNPFYVEEFLNYLVGRGIDPTDTRRDQVARASEQPPEPDPEPDRSPRRGAPADPEGRERRRPGLPGTGPPARLSGDRLGGPG